MMQFQFSVLEGLPASFRDLRALKSDTIKKIETLDALPESLGSLIC